MNISLYNVKWWYCYIKGSSSLTQKKKSTVPCSLNVIKNIANVITVPQHWCVLTGLVCHRRRLPGAGRHEVCEWGSSGSDIPGFTPWSSGATVVQSWVTPEVPTSREPVQTDPSASSCPDRGLVTASNRRVPRLLSTAEHYTDVKYTARTISGAATSQPSG